MSQVQPPLAETGERMVPERSHRYTFWEHVYRYRFAAPCAAGKRVLDIACGEGYGSAALAAAGAEVTGVDVSEETCIHARAKYGIRALQGNAEKIPLKDRCVDLVVSFETIEHVAKPEVFLKECARVLTPGGRLIISTPNLIAYNRYTPHNPYHQKELAENEFLALISADFRAVQMHAQCPAFARWWSPWGLSSRDSLWYRWRGFGRLREYVQAFWCPEIINPKALEAARRDPVAAIRSRPGGFSHLANPFAVRRGRRFLGATPLYFIASATLA